MDQVYFRKIFHVLAFALILVHLGCSSKQTEKLPANVIPASEFPGADSIVNFISKNKDKSSLYIVLNDNAVAALNEEKMMPLASTVKMLVAIEFAKQAASNVIDTAEYIPLSELDKYYIPNTDVNAHPEWIEYERVAGHINKESAKLIDIAHGMILFSSNANTDFLMDKLGFNKIEENIKTLGLKSHSHIFPLVSSLFIYQNPEKIHEERKLAKIKSLSEEEYIKQIFAIHAKLKTSATFKNTFRPQDLSFQMQKLWSDRLISSTTKDYTKVCKAINDRKLYSPETYSILAYLSEDLMQNPANKEWMKHAGFKNGSTMFVLTEAMYASLKNEKKFEMAVFFNDLTVTNNRNLTSWLNDLRLAVLLEPDFLKKMNFD